MRPAVLLLLLMGMLFVPATGHAQEPGAGCPQLPVNLHVASSYRDWITDLMARSPTLRRQCEVLASAAHVQVYVESSRYLSGCCRARANFRRVGRVMRVLIEIPLTADFPELLAHELEHVIEQIEGVNLRAMAGMPRSGVREVGTNVYETSRAATAGRAAALEARTCRNAGEFDCGRSPALMMAAKD
jgi:hypothetical protein